MIELDHRSRVERIITGLSVPIVNNQDKPRSIPLIHERNENSFPKVPVVTPHYVNNLPSKEVLEDKKQKLIEAVGIPGLLLAVPNFAEVDEIPRIHPGGSSRYLVEMRLNNDIFMVLTLEPNKLTSIQHFNSHRLPFDMRLNLPHDPIIDTFLEPSAKQKTMEDETIPSNSQEWHLDGEGDDLLPGIEYYDIVYGLALLHHIEGDEGCPMPKHFYIEPGVNHQMEGGPKGAVFTIRMKYAAIYPPELRHIHMKDKE